MHHRSCRDLEAPRPPPAPGSIVRYKRQNFSLRGPTVAPDSAGGLPPRDRELLVRQLAASATAALAWSGRRRAWKWSANGCAPPTIGSTASRPRRMRRSRMTRRPSAWLFAGLLLAGCACFRRSRRIAVPADFTCPAGSGQCWLSQTHADRLGKVLRPAARVPGRPRAAAQGTDPDRPSGGAPSADLAGRGAEGRSRGVVIARRRAQARGGPDRPSRCDPRRSQGIGAERT